MMTTFRKFRRQTDPSCRMHPKRPPGPALAPAPALERLKFSMRLSVTDQKFSCNAWMQPATTERMKLTMKFPVTDQKFSCSAWGDEPEAPLLAKLLKL